MKEFFPENEYKTPADTKRYLGDRLALGSRWNFVYEFARIVLRCRSYAVSGVYDSQKWAETSLDVLRCIERSGGRFHIEGLEHLRNNKEPVVVVGNHMSTLETVTLPAMIQPFFEVTYVVKEKLVKGPIFSPVMTSRDPIVLARKNPREDLQKVLIEGAEKLANGRSLIIFPQSTRRAEFIPKQFNSLGIKLARRAKVKIIPVAVKTDFWSNGKLLKGFGPLDRSKTIHFKFGPPMEITGNGNEQHAQIVEFIQQNLDRWGHPRYSGD
jgi:1-acyl-sn-glycerol-3-phosphate acyltransferase